MGRDRLYVDAYLAGLIKHRMVQEDVFVSLWHLDRKHRKAASCQMNRLYSGPSPFRSQDVAAVGILKDLPGDSIIEVAHDDEITTISLQQVLFYKEQDLSFYRRGEIDDDDTSHKGMVFQRNYAKHIEFSRSALQGLVDQPVNEAVDMPWLQGTNIVITSAETLAGNNSDTPSSTILRILTTRPAIAREITL